MQTVKLFDGKKKYLQKGIKLSKKYLFMGIFFSI
jgi:hypothetical protein